MEAFLFQLLAGFANGCIYGCIALALVMIYQSTGHVNFAQGEMAMFSTYLAATMLSAGLPYWVAALATIGLSLVGGMAIQAIFMRPVEKAPVLASIAVFVGMLVIFNSVAGWIWGFTSREFPSPFQGLEGLGGKYMGFHELGMVMVTLVVMALVFSFFRFTKMGLAMRAAAFNPVSSQLLGIRIQWMQSLGWGLAGALGAVAGMLAAPVVYLDPHMMSGLLLYGFAAALVGGITNPWGAVAGGLFVGIFENLAGAYLVGTELKLATALALILGVLVFMPAGLFGRRIVNRV